MADLIAGLLEPQWREAYWNDTVFRHRKGPQDLVSGPNTLLADGHVEVTVDISVLTDENASLRN